MCSVVLLWITAQLVVITYFYGSPQGSDPGEYLKLAKSCYASGGWYPMPANIYSPWICATGLINFLILQLRVFGTCDLNVFFNLLMNVAIVFELYIIGGRFFDRRTSCIAVITWCLMYSNLMIVVPAGTEIPFLFLVLSGFCLCTSPRPRPIWMGVAGVLFTLANWIRPLAIIFLTATLIYMLYRRYSWRSYASLLFPLILTLFIIGKTTERRTGYFLYQPSLFGANLITTSNDRAYGGNATSLLSDSTSSAFIANRELYTFHQRDSIWRERAFEWILSNPDRYLWLYIKKLGGLYIEDSWSDRPLLGGDGFIDAYSTTDNKVTARAFRDRVIWMSTRSITYYLVLIAFVLAMIRWLRRCRNWRELISGQGILLLILLMGTFATCIFAVSPRYHYPYIFVVVLFASWWLSLLRHRHPLP
jgi:hypothetical protein